MEIPRFLLPFCFLVPLAPAEMAVVYEEDFESFPVGDDMLLGTGGWIGTGTGLGLHGIDFFDGGFGNSGFLGYFPLTGSVPAAATTRVGRPVGFDPLAEGAPEVTLAAILGIQDSTNQEGDNFFVSVYNAAGQIIASVNFDNSGQSPAIFRFDGVNFFQTGATFVYDTFYEFTAEIDFGENRWSAFLGDAPLFVDAPFSSRLVDQDFGFVFFEWEVFDTEPVLRPGDNWMLFDELEVLAEVPPFASPGVEPGGLSYFSEPKYAYQVEYSDDLVTWKADLPGSSKTAAEPAGKVVFTDPAPPAEGRYYRVVRTAAE